MLTLSTLLCFVFFFILVVFMNNKVESKLYIFIILTFSTLNCLKIVTRLSWQLKLCMKNSQITANSCVQSVLDLEALLSSSSPVNHHPVHIPSLWAIYNFAVVVLPLCKWKHQKVTRNETIPVNF